MTTLLNLFSVYLSFEYILSSGPSFDALQIVFILTVFPNNLTKSKAAASIMNCSFLAYAVVALF